MTDVVDACMQPRDAYSRSIALFAEGLSGKARDLALARAAQCMASNATRSAAAPLQRPAVTPSSHSSLRQVTPPFGSHANPHAFRTTPPIVMSTPHSSSTTTVQHSSWPISRTPGFPAASAASPPAVSRAQQQLPDRTGSMGVSSRNHVNAFGPSFTPTAHSAQQHHRSLVSQGSTAHSQYSHYRPPLSGLTVTSHGAGMSLPSMIPASMQPAASPATPAVTSSRHVAAPSGFSSDPLKHSSAMSHPGHDPLAGSASQQAGFRGVQGLPESMPSHPGSDRSSAHSLPGQQHRPNFHLLQQRGPSPLDTMPHAAHHQMQRAPSPQGQSGSYGGGASSLHASQQRGAHASPWHAQQQSVGLSNNVGQHQQPSMHESRPVQNHPRLPTSSAVHNAYPSSAQQGLHVSHQGSQPPSSGSLPMHEPGLPRGLAYGTSTWGM